MRKINFRPVLFFIFWVSSLQASSQNDGEVCYNPNQVKDSSKRSIKSMAFAVAANDSIKINYHSPGVRKRIIWGGLVPFDEVWVTGAHDATTIDFPQAVIINAVEIPAGKYAFFTIPGESEWTLIINRNWEQHLASEYDAADDLLRLQVRPIQISHVERLQYFVELDAKQKAGTISVAWEKLKLQFAFIMK